MAKFEYVDIGSSNFYNSFYKIKNNEIGILVEPNLEAISKIPNRTNVIKAPIALSDKTRVGNLYYIPMKNIRKFRFPYWMYGCAFIGDVHPTLKARNVPRSAIETQFVLVYSWQDFLQLYDITEIVNLTIDIEGGDWIILKELIKNPIPVERIVFEMNSISSPELITYVNKFQEIGYEFGVEQGEDFYLEKKK